MTRMTKILSLSFLLLFILACSTLTQPFNQAQELAATAQSLATAMPVETLKSMVTQMPTFEAQGTGLPNFEGYFNPEGTPVSEWKGIPVMPQATAGQEFPENSTYSYKVNATVEEAQEYYKTELEKLGWSSTFTMPGNENVAVQMFQKDNNLLTVTITDMSGEVVVVLNLP